ncbi:MAG: glutamate--tRNA ligase [Chloroflexi bacterium]|nr:glutamate--tRNA ligase [Chloroflexota bacterium]
MTVRVRFAPSPTGSLHIGSVRTTLYNYLFARQSKGTLILRIEDTDQERFVPEALDSIYDGLGWVGITWDEGPREGGPHGPYVQSERLSLYQERARALVSQGDAYPCFCSKERLASVRTQQQTRGEVTRYDRNCRTIEPARAAARAASEPHVIRLKVPEDGTIALDDLVYGHVEWPLRAIEDQVLLKSDGFPTYQLAVVVDDHRMRISHVFRGEDWLPSTPKHLLVYRAFGWEAPPHAHLPNVLGPDGKKLSKRHGATRVEEFRAQGYLPEALLNYLALIGWSPGTEEEVFDVARMIELWRIEQVHKAGGKWDRERLDHFNGLHIRALGPDALFERLAAFAPAHWDRALLRRTVPLVQERLRTLAEFPDLVSFLFDDAGVKPAAAQLVPKKREAAETVEALAQAAVVTRFADWSAAALEGGLRGAADELGWKAGDLFMALRLAVTGKTVTPPIIDSILLLGRERALARIERAQEALQEGPPSIR